jgi:hypothetical protein
MEKLFEYLKSIGVSAIIPTPKGVIIPMEQVLQHNLDVATLSPLVPTGYRCSELKKQFRGDACGSLFIGLKPVVDVDKVYSNAQAHLESLGK